MALNVVYGWEQFAGAFGERNAHCTMHKAIQLLPAGDAPRIPTNEGGVVAPVGPATRWTKAYYDGKVYEIL